MAILNMNYSVSGSGGGNIGEPLNLTVTTSGLNATITWEDNEIGTIPPTTFQKSELVRKIGSAPTSPSDGDLVITETVKDTYKTTGYVDQGLIPGETYYYKVFSYSDLGGISYCDAVSVTPRGLPTTYQEVEYIESSGTQWIDTGVTPNQDTVSQIKVQFKAFSGNVVYGYNQTSDNDQTDYRFFNGYAYADGTVRSPGRCVLDIPVNKRIETAENTFALDTDYYLEIGNNYVKNIDSGTNIGTGSVTASFTGTTTITLDHCDSNSQNASNRWYSVVINDGSNDIRDLVPCYRKADGVIGMYDIVNDQFYTNSGTGTYTKGPDVN